MSHRFYRPAVEQLAEDYDVADEAMTAMALSVLEGHITVAEGELLLAEIAGQIKARARRWAAEVLPTVVADARFVATERVGPVLADDSTVQKAALEVHVLNLVDSLENVAEQMARDARFQVRQGMLIRAEEQIGA